MHNKSTSPTNKGTCPGCRALGSWDIGLRGAPKISVLRGSERTVRVSVPKFRISVRTLHCAFKTTMLEVEKIFFEATDSKSPFM